MKKLITLALALAGMVSTASATDYYVAGSNIITNQTSDGAWEPGNAANKMTLQADGTYKLVVTGKSLAAYQTCEYKITEGSWDNDYGWDGGNAYFDVHVAGTYTITYIFDPSKEGNNRVLQAEAQLMSYADNEGIYLRCNDNWDSDEDAYKFVSNGSGLFTLDVDVSSITTDNFYYRFHYTSDSGEFGGYQDNEISLNNGFFTGYEINLAGSFWKETGKNHNFVLPLLTKPCAKVHLELTIVNKMVTMNMLCYEKAATNDKGYTTFVNYYPLTISDATAYYATDDNDGTATAHAITNPAASTPMLIKGDASTTYYFAVASEGTSYSSTNAFHAGSGSGVSGNDGDSYNYILKGDAFYLANGNTVAANKAYLKLTQAAKGRVLKFFDNEETGINAVTTKTNNANACYNLNGQRVANPTKGLYIRDGKKVMVK